MLGDEVCGDNDEYRLGGHSSKSCSWIGSTKYRRAKFCAMPIVSENCRLTCYICCYEADISSKSEYCTFDGHGPNLFTPPDFPPFRHPPFTPEILTKELPGVGLDPDYGVLKDLAGVWVNYKSAFGLHSTILPSPGTNPEFIPGKFHYVCENYVETLEFTILDVAARNRGTSIYYWL